MMDAGGMQCDLMVLVCVWRVVSARPAHVFGAFGGDFSGSLGIPLRVRSIAQAASGSHPSSLVCDVRAISYLGSTPVIPCPRVSKACGGV